MRTTLLALLMSLVAAGPAAAATKPVEVGDFFFRSPYVTVGVGDSVTWTVRDRAQAHTVTRRGAFDSDLLTAGETFTRTFDRPGSYEYLCELHTDAMRGVVQVGPDRERPALRRLAVRRKSRSLRVAVGLTEWSKVSIVVRREGRRVASRKSKLLRKGRPVLTVRTGRLRTGRYRVTAVARDPAGNRSESRRARLRVR